MNDDVHRQAVQPMRPREETELKRSIFDVLRRSSPGLLIPFGLTTNHPNAPPPCIEQAFDLGKVLAAIGRFFFGDGGIVELGNPQGVEYWKRF